MKSNRKAGLLASAVAVFIGFPEQSLLGDTLVTHRIPAALALEAVGEAVSICAKQGYRVTATVINPDGVRIATLHGDGSGLHTIDASYAKAYAAVSFAAPVANLETSGQLGEKYKDQPAFQPDRKSTRLNSSHQIISYAVFCLKKKTESPAAAGSLARDLTPPS